MARLSNWQPQRRRGGGTLQTGRCFAEPFLCATPSGKTAGIDATLAQDLRPGAVRPGTISGLRRDPSQLADDLFYSASFLCHSCLLTTSLRPVTKTQPGLVLGGKGTIAGRIAVALQAKFMGQLNRGIGTLESVFITYGIGSQTLAYRPAGNVKSGLAPVPVVACRENR